MRKTSIAVGEYYHILNRGNHKQPIFKDERDWARFLFLILYFQSPVNFPQVGRIISSFVKNSVFDTSSKITTEIINTRYTKLTGFVLMPNHFHLVVEEKEENGIARYMHRVLLSYTKYFNTKYQTSGHLFQGPYNAVHIEDNDQLLYLSAYIHRNPRELSTWKNKEHEYFWSSYKDYIDKNRWPELLKTDIILDQFKNKNEYKNFIETSAAKEFLDEFDNLQ
jgi:putative transposase